MAIVEAVELLERNSRETIIRVKATSEENLKKIYVTSGQVLEQTSNSITLRVVQNDSLLINRRIALWWDQEKGRFIRQ